MEPHTVRITDKEPEVAAYCMWLILLQETHDFVYSEPCYAAETNAHITAFYQRNGGAR